MTIGRNMLYDIQHVHVELSSLCNARCPLCPRSSNGYPYNHGYTETNLSLMDIKKIFSPAMLSGLNEILINGNFGDFVMNPESLDIISYWREHNTQMRVFVSTNGSARNKDFWRRLGELDIDVLFCIDGLEDTHHLYRQDTSYDLVINNAQTFIDAGGRAIWKMIKFDHNAHQVEEAKRRAEQMGFQSLRINETIRDSGPVYNRQGKKVYTLKSDIQGWPDQLTKEWVEGLVKHQAIMIRNQSPTDTVIIDCQAKRDRSIYLSADGHVYPCCWTGFSPRTFRPPTSISHWNREISAYVRHNHAPTVGLAESLAWFEDLAQSWQSDQQPLVCKRFCQVKEQ